MFELAYAAGLRAEELVDLDAASLDPDAEQLRVEGKGGKTRVVPAGEPPGARSTRYLTRGAARARRRRRASPRCSCPRAAGGCRPRTCAAA